MKIFWTVEDIVTGLVVNKPGTSECWMLGFVVEPPSGTYYTMNSLEDGMVCKHGMLKEHIVEVLNNGGYVPILDSENDRLFQLSFSTGDQLSELPTDRLMKEVGKRWKDSDNKGFMRGFASVLVGQELPDPPKGEFVVVKTPGYGTTETKDWYLVRSEPNEPPSFWDPQLDNAHKYSFTEACHLAEVYGCEVKPYIPA